jgi:hypothetical protein
MMLTHKLFELGLSTDKFNIDIAYAFLIKIITLRVCIISVVLILIFLLVFLHYSLVLIRVLVLLKFGLESFLFFFLDLINLIHGFDDPNGSFHCILILIDFVLHFKHLKVRIQGVLPHSIEMEICLVFMNLLKMLLNVVIILHRHSVVALSKVRIANLHFVPHSLHIVNIKFIALFAKEAHSFFSFLNLVSSDLESR